MDSIVKISEKQIEEIFLKLIGNQDVDGEKTFNEVLRSIEFKLSNGFTYSITDDGLNQGLTINNSSKTQKVSFYLDSASDRVDIKTTRTGGYLFDKSISSVGIIEGNSFKLSSLNTAPTSATDTGTTGEIRYTADYIYVCVATDTWKRTALSTW